MQKLKTLKSNNNNNNPFKTTEYLNKIIVI